MTKYIKDGSGAMHRADAIVKAVESGGTITCTLDYPADTAGTFTFSGTATTLENLIENINFGKLTFIDSSAL